MESRVIFISSYLEDVAYGKEVAKQLKDKETEYGLTIRTIKSNSCNVWCRDYMPVMTKSGKLVQFTYNPSYMQSEYWQKRIPVSQKIHDEFGLNCDSSCIILDGGAIEIFDDMAIVSDRVFRDNQGMESVIIREIEDKLELDRLIVIPQHPYDFTGHVDGLVRFINKDTVIINDLSGEMKKSKERHPARHKLEEHWYYSFKMALYNSGLECKELPCTMHHNSKDKDAAGIYINFLLLDDLIIIPRFNDKPTDNKVKDNLESLYKRKAIQVEAKDLAAEGGVVNCVTWNI